MYIWQPDTPSVYTATMSQAPRKWQCDICKTVGSWADRRNQPRECKECGDLVCKHCCIDYCPYCENVYCPECILGHFQVEYVRETDRMREAKAKLLSDAENLEFMKVQLRQSAREICKAHGLRQPDYDDAKEEHNESKE